MGKPFKLQGQDNSRVAITRGEGGKFQRLEAESPGKVIDESKSSGETTTVVSRAHRVPMHPVSEQPDASSGDAVAKQEIPLPPAGRINDADRLPMRLKES